MSKVSIKILRFFQIGAQFKTNEISKEVTKCNYLVAQLKPKYVENIWYIISRDCLTKHSDSKAVAEFLKKAKTLELNK